METFVTVAVILAMIALGALLLHLLNLQHNDTLGSFHYGRSGLPVPGPDPEPHRTRPGRRRRRIRKGTQAN